MKRALFLSLCVLVLFGLVGCREKEITGKSTTDDEKEYMKLYLNDIEIPIIWAKVFNLKQMAQTMNYLSENNLLEYAVLEEKATAATAHHNELSAQIKAAEKRMAEIAVLRTHIVNYVDVSGK